MRFWGSPQHFAGFLFVSLPIFASIAFRLNGQISSYVFVLLSVLAIFTHQAVYKYGGVNGFVETSRTSLYERQLVGDPLEFPIQDDIYSLKGEIKGLLQRNELALDPVPKNLFFAIRGKTHLELLLSKPLYPLTYDFYTTPINGLDGELVKRLQRFDYILVPSVDEIDAQIDFVSLSRQVADQEDYSKHLAVLKTLKDVSNHTHFSTVDCSEAYCLLRSETR